MNCQPEMRNGKDRRQLRAAFPPPSLESRLNPERRLTWIVDEMANYWVQAEGYWGASEKDLTPE